MDSPDTDFDRLMLPHLDAAYRLARWLVANEHDAQDRVQDAFVRAFRFFPRFRGEDGRAWLLTIVRNVCYSWLRQRQRETMFEPLDEDFHAPALPAASELERRADAEVLESALGRLPVPVREILVLRELEGLSYREIAAVSELPIGTVMSRLARARQQLQAEVARQLAPDFPRP